MGFFKDFKRDFAQAVNELMPDKDELGAEYDDEDMFHRYLRIPEPFPVGDVQRDAVLQGN